MSLGGAGRTGGCTQAGDPTTHQNFFKSWIVDQYRHAVYQWMDNFMRNAMKQATLKYVYYIKSYSQETSWGGVIVHHAHRWGHCPKHCRGRGPSWEEVHLWPPPLGDAKPSDTTACRVSSSSGKCFVGVKTVHWALQEEFL